MNNAEHMRLLRKQRERAKMREAEIVKALKIEDIGKMAPKPEPDPEPEPEDKTDDHKEDVIDESIPVRDGDERDSEQDKGDA
jgi:hypothetical protein